MLVSLLIVGSWAISSTQQNFLSARTWPIEQSSVASGAVGQFTLFHPDTTDDLVNKAGAQAAVGMIPGAYLIIHKPSRMILDTYPVPIAAVGLNSEAYLASASATLSQEWFLSATRMPDGKAEYTISNRGTGKALTAPLAAGVSVATGADSHGGWLIEGDQSTGYSIIDLSTGSYLGSGGEAMNFYAITNEASAHQWDVELIKSSSPLSDTTLGFMPLLPTAAEQVCDGMYAITDGATGANLCAYITPEGGVGDYEAYLGMDCHVEHSDWSFMHAIPQPGNLEAQANPPKIYQVMEDSSNLVLDAYQFGTFGANVRGNDHKIAQRWLFEKAGPGDKYWMRQVSDLRYLGVADDGMHVATQLKPHVWNLKLLHCFPAAAVPATPVFPVVPTDDCAPLVCEENMCDMVPDGCGVTMDCGGCLEGLVCDMTTNACLSDPMAAIPSVPPTPAVPPQEELPTIDPNAGVVAVPEPPAPPPPCPECAPCAEANATVANATPAAPAPLMNASDGANNTMNGTNGSFDAETMELLRMLAPEILGELHDYLVNAAVQSMAAYPVNESVVRLAANSSLTLDSIISEALFVDLPQPVKDHIYAKAYNKAEINYNQSLAEHVVSNILPAFLQNLVNPTPPPPAGANGTNSTNGTNGTANGTLALDGANATGVNATNFTPYNLTHELFEEADQLAFNAAIQAAGPSAAAGAVKGAFEAMSAATLQQEVAKKAFDLVQNMTVGIATDVAVNTLTYNIEETVHKGVTFDPTEVMFRTRQGLTSVNAYKDVADEVAGLLTQRVQVISANWTSPNVTGPHAMLLPANYPLPPNVVPPGFPTPPAPSGAGGVSQNIDMFFSTSTTTSTFSVAAWDTTTFSSTAFDVNSLDYSGTSTTSTTSSTTSDVEYNLIAGLATPN